MLTRAVFQSGISWRVVEAKWPGTREALCNFDPEQSFPDFEAVSADLVKRFKFLGATGAYYFLHVVGEPVPPHEERMAAHQPPARSRSTTSGPFAR